MSELIRQAYVKSAHGVRGILSKTKFLHILEQSKSRRAKWFRSLFAIYDVDDLIHLDLPWWTFDAVDFMTSFLAERKDARVFEWGSGASTIWLSKRGAKVTAVEHDAVWAEKIKTLIQEFPGTTLKTVPSRSVGKIGSLKRGFENQFFDDYVDSINDIEGKFDLIVIDGRAREACLTEAVHRLEDGGYILFDDTKRQRYKLAISNSGLNQQRFAGLAVSLPLPDATDLLSHST